MSYWMDKYPLLGRDEVERHVSVIVEDFHDLFYKEAVLVNYLGHQCQKNPLDLWIFQEIIFETKPDVIIECGTAAGGTTLFLAHLLEQIGNGKIISIDLADRKEILPKHPRIEYWVANTLDYYNTTGRMFFEDKKVMVILDSDHSEEHVYYELLSYSRKVSVGQYLIVEDTNINGHPVGVERAPGGPMEAAQRFLRENPNFVVDRSREKLLCTFNPSGYLKRMS